MFFCKFSLEPEEDERKAQYYTLCLQIIYFVDSAHCFCACALRLGRLVAPFQPRQVGLLRSWNGSPTSQFVSKNKKDRLIPLRTSSVVWIGTFIMVSNVNFTNTFVMLNLDCRNESQMFSAIQGRKISDRDLSRGNTFDRVEMVVSMFLTLFLHHVCLEQGIRHLRQIYHALVPGFGSWKVCPLRLPWIGRNPIPTAVQRKQLSRLSEIFHREKSQSEVLSP